MTNDLKFYLLAEEGGWNCSAYAYQYGDKIKNSDAYKILSYNIIKGKKHLSARAQSICTAYNNISFDTKTLKESFILETKINYLSLHSFPAYYINPLAVDPNYRGEVTTIGELIFDYRGKEKTLNEIILDNSVSPDIKKEEVNKKLEYYLSDMNRIARDSFKAAEGGTVSSKDTAKEKRRTVFEIISLSFMTVLMITIFTYHFPILDRYIFFPDFTKAMTYVVYLFPILYFLFAISTSVYHSYKAKISEPYNYASRFLKKNKSSIYDDIKSGKEKLYNYVSNAIDNKIVLVDDIKDFSKLSSSYIDFKAVLEVDSIKKKPTYRILSSLNGIFLTLSLVMSFISLIIFILGLAFNVSI